MVDTFFGGGESNINDSLNTIADNLLLNNEQIGDVVQPLFEEIGQLLSAGDKDLTKVCKVCKSTITRAINTITSDLDGITSFLGMTIDTMSAETMAILETLYTEVNQPFYLADIPSYGPVGSITQPPIPTGGSFPQPGTMPLPPIGGLPMPQPMPPYPPSQPPFPIPPQPGTQPQPLPPAPLPMPFPTPRVPPGAIPQPQPGVLPFPQPQPLPSGLPQPQPQPIPPLPIGIQPLPSGQPLPPQPLPPVSLPPSPIGGFPPMLPPGAIPPVSSFPPLPGYAPPLPPSVPLPPGSTTVLPPTGGNTIVVVQPCCEPQPQPQPGTSVGGSAQEQPPLTLPPKVRVKGAGGDRPDDIEAGKCEVAGDKYVIPKPGTAEWCKVQDGMIILLSKLGNQIVDWIGEALQNTYDVVNQWANKPDPAFANPLEIGDGLFTLFARAISRISKPMLQAIWNYYCNVKRGIVSVGGCDTSTLIGMYAVKAVITVLRQVRFGSDAAVWLTVDVAFDMPSFEAAVEYLCNAACPYRIPEPAEADEAWLRGGLDDDTYRCWLKAHAVDPAVHTPVLWAKREQLTPEQTIKLGRRIKATDDAISDSLRYVGVVDREDARRLQFLYDELPTIGDHLEWLRRNVFDDEYVKDFDLMNGFEERFWKKFGDDLRAQGMKKEYAALHYAAHWINPSMGQLFQMVQRNRPGRVDPSIQFTEQDLLRLMAEQDVAPYFRERLRHIAYVPFGLRFLRQVYDARQISDDEAVERFQDLGYSKEDAITLEKSERIRRARTTATGTRGYTVPTIQKLFLAGKLTRAQVIERLDKIGYPLEAANDAIAAWVALQELKAKDQGEKTARAEFIKGVKNGLTIGVITEEQAITALSSQGFSQDNARAFAVAVITNERIAISNKGLAIIRRGVMQGKLHLADTTALLVSMGFAQWKITESINQWTAELAAGRRVLAKSEIVKMAIEGLITLPVARQRLLNLNYEDADSILILAEAQQRIAQNEQKVINQEQKAAKVQADAIARAIKLNQAQLERLRKNLYSLGTPQQIGKWYVAGLVGDTWVRERLTLMGKIQGDIDLMLLEWQQERADRRAKQAKAAAGK